MSDDLTNFCIMFARFTESFVGVGNDVIGRELTSIGDAGTEEMFGRYVGM